MHCSNMKLSRVHLNHLPTTYGFVSRHMRGCTKIILVMVVPEPFTSLYGCHFLRKCFHRGEKARRSRNLKRCKHITVFLSFPQEFRPAALKICSTTRLQDTFEQWSRFFVLIAFSLMLPENFGRQDTWTDVANYCCWSILNWFSAGCHQCFCCLNCSGMFYANTRTDPARWWAVALSQPITKMQVDLHTVCTCVTKGFTQVV